MQRFVIWRFSVCSPLLHTLILSRQFVTKLYTVSQRGVVFFRNQDLDVEDQKVLVQKLGELTGKPSSSKLYRDVWIDKNFGLPVNKSGKLDYDVSVVSAHLARRFHQDRVPPASTNLASIGWHSE